MSKRAPRILDSPAYRTLREGDMDLFKQLVEEAESTDFSYCNLASVDLRGTAIEKVVLRGARLKGADLRGLDLSSHNLDGVTLSNARISGVLFPRDLSAAEIRLSVEMGTRIRHRASEVEEA